MPAHRHYGLTPRNVRREPPRIHFDMGAMLFVFAIYLGVVIGYFWFVFTARSQDNADRIQQQGLKNAVGEWCCGTNDCDAVPVTITAQGYRIVGIGRDGEIIPYAEAVPLSPDGKVWVCRRPDGTRRCVFDQPKGF